MEVLRNRSKILIVDDNPSDQIIITRAFEDGDIAGEFNCVSNGEEALKYLKREPPYDNREIYPLPDLILMDINMPIMDGISTVKAIRGDLYIHNIPVIMFTTSSSNHDIDQSYTAGANAYIKKPNSGREYIDILKNLGTFWFQCVVFPKVAD